MKTREIKFRAFWRDTLKPVEDFNEEYTISACNDEAFIVNQFTGVKDKNSKDIYEGDKLRITLYDGEWETTVRDYYGTLVIDVEGCEYNTTALSFLDDEAEVEIIGNIYE